MQPVMQNNKVYDYQQLDQRTNQVKSPSVLTFGGQTLANNQCNSSNMSQHPFIANNPDMQQHMTALQEQTLNKQGQIPVPKDQKPGGAQQAISKINPKDLTNDELEFIIRTGKLPQRLDQPQQPQQQWQVNPLQNSNFGAVLTQQSLIQSQQNIPQQAFQQLQKTSSQHQQLHNYIGNPQSYNKENFYIQSAPTNANEQDINQRELKNYNSPRMVPESYQVPQTQQNVAQFQYQQKPQAQPTLLTAQIQPIQHLSTSVAQSYQQLQGSFYNLDQSQQLAASKVETSQCKDQNQQSAISQAASQAMKALSEKIKQLEQQNQLLEDKLSLSGQQSQDSSQRLNTKLKEEMERSSNRETQLREEIAIMKKRVENVESEKLRHLEENCQEREKWRKEVKRVEEENVQLRKQVQDQVSRFDEIEGTIQELKRREQSLRDRYEQELHNEKSKAKLMTEEMDEHRSRYEQLKQKIVQKNKDLTQERDQLNDRVDQEVQDRKKEVGKLQSECAKWKRESQMLKEELSILNQRESSKPSKREISQTHPVTQRNSGIPGSTPKGNQSGRGCYSPGHLKSNDSKSTLHTFDQTTQHFKSIESEIGLSQPKKKVKSSKRRDKKVEKGHPSVSVSTHNHCKESDDTKKGLHDTQIATTVHQIKSLNQSERKQRQSSASASAQKKHQKSRKSSKSKQPRHHSSAKKKSQDTQITGRHIGNTLSQSNLISINTKFNRAESVSVDDVNIFSNSLSKDQHNNDILLLNNKFQASRALKNNSQDGTADKGPNQYKRTSGGDILQFGLSTTSEFQEGFLNSQGNILGNSMKQKPLDLAEFTQPSVSSGVDQQSKQVDNEIFYLEREIFDYNQQYKTLLSQSNGSPTYSMNNDGVSINSKLRQIAQQLEEKSERLFQLKKQQQQLLMQQTYKDKNPFSESQSLTSTGIKAYQVRQNF